HVILLPLPCRCSSDAVVERDARVPHETTVERFSRARRASGCRSHVVTRMTTSEAGRIYSRGVRRNIPRRRGGDVKRSCAGRNLTNRSSLMSHQTYRVFVLPN